jgi:hypothetical protein
MTDLPRKKKRSEKLSDSFAARLAREIGPSNRLDAIAAASRTSSERQHERPALASMQSSQRNGFTKCPHCREYVPWRDTCRACGTPIG